MIHHYNTAVLAGNDFFDKKYQPRQKKIHNSIKIYILINKKFLKAEDLLLLFLEKNLCFIIGVGHRDLFFMQIGPKKQFLSGFSNFFS